MAIRKASFKPIVAKLAKLERDTVKAQKSSTVKADQARLTKRLKKIRKARKAMEDSCTAFNI